LEQQLSQTKKQVHQNKINMNSDWQLQAACRSTPDTDDFFDTREPYLRALSKKYCQSCPVRAQCLYVSLVNEDIYGLWGSLTPKQRRFYMREIYSYAQDRNISTLDWSNELDEIFQLFSTTSRLSQHF
jgi:WhiB family redox-sensing transcriptional regulator